jgi:superfamily II DNA or RNA helicase
LPLAGRWGKVWVRTLPLTRFFSAPLPMPPIPAPPLQITEKLLIAAGGWQAIKHARGLREMDRVSGARWTPPLLQGLVREGEREYRSGLRILSPTNIENICTCRPSREFGTICAHSLAVGLAIVAGQTPVARPEPGASAAGPVPATPTPVLPYTADPEAPGRLHIVLAPDLAAAWAKGQLLVGLERVVGGNRALLVPDARVIANNGLNPEDFRAVERLAQIIGAVPTGMSFLTRDQFLAFLGALAAHPRIGCGRSARVVVESAALKPRLRAAFREDQSLGLEIRWPEGSRPLAGSTQAWLLRPGASQTTLQRIAPGLPAAYFSIFETPMRLAADQAAAFLALEWPRLEPFFELQGDLTPPVSMGQAEGGTVAASGVVAGEPRFIFSVEGSLHQLGAKLQAVYPNKRTIIIGVTPEREMFTYPAPAPAGTPGILHTRNPMAERAALARLVNWGFQGPDNTGHYFLRGEDFILRFFSLGLPPLQKDWNVSVGTRFQDASREVETLTPVIGVRGSGQDWFDLELSLTGSSGERYPASEIQRLLQMGGGQGRLRNGKRAIISPDALQDLQEVLRDCDPGQPQPGVFRMRKSQGAYLAATFERWGAATGPSWEKWRAREGGLNRPADPLLTPELLAQLRPYQLDGVRWLHLLAANGLGGILADEMGLGKTLQALAYLSAQKAGATGKKPALAPALVVCPTSLVENWRREALRFTPELRTLAIDGPGRGKLLAQIGEADMVITSYALLRRDMDHYYMHTFSTVILDEAHHIKNPDSQVAQAACELKSLHRFVLTGTPMENSVRDLWSIMRFALPGYLGIRDDFRERYEQPLAKGGGEEVRERLSRRLRPVLLRRRKRDVAKELPDRIEQTAFCELTPAQRKAYQQLLEQSRLKLDLARQQKQAGQGRMLVLTALLRLRQACCDVRLLGLAPEKVAPGENTPAAPAKARPPATNPAVPGVFIAPPPSPSSAKLTLLDELLEEIVEGGHRVLIFSQFVSMLKILSEHLDSAGMKYSYLDGGTKPKDRTAAVERFQTDESVTAFLISVKAGGVGLNLTGADTVIHFDPWWNPAVEAQATDRAHRIGQTKVVTAYRLIARGTVEEKIFALQNRKKELTKAVVEREADEPLLESLSFEEIESLLE